MNTEKEKDPNFTALENSEVYKEAEEIKTRFEKELEALNEKYPNQLTVILQMGVEGKINPDGKSRENGNALITSGGMVGELRTALCLAEIAGSEASKELLKVMLFGKD